MKGSLAALLCPALLCPAAALAQATASQSAQPAPPTQSAPAAQSATPPLQFHDLPPDSHTLTPAEEAQQRQQEAVAMAMRLASIQARWGPEMSTPGLATQLVEAGRTKTADGATEITYHVSGTGYTPGDHLTLIRWPLDGPSQNLMSGLTMDANGTAVCGPPAPANAPAAPAPVNAPKAPKAPPCTNTLQPKQPVALQVTAAPGEPVRIALIDDDRHRGAAVTTVPFPIAAQDQSCRLQIILGVKDASMVLVEGTGFPANTPLKVDTTSGGQTRTLHPTTNPEGRFIVADLPATKGETTGTSTVRFAGVTKVPTLDDSKAGSAEPTCAPSVTFHWGPGTYKPE